MSDDESVQQGSRPELFTVLTFKREVGRKEIVRLAEERVFAWCDDRYPRVLVIIGFVSRPSLELALECRDFRHEVVVGRDNPALPFVPFSRSRRRSA